ncbi:protein MAIN-LIKE 1-like [Arachis ipaensis]|uniref:protein MAIN-LIKE 1-like n=1 Tax=Arachis ipaensis TaxID=130454 RepID=UPI0007AF53BA|nr:protein MAIN-LIKE 1-like [Arachis ipaensis]
MEIRRQRLEPYLRRTGFYHASLIKHFEYDNPLISALVERWRPETHTFHFPWGECTITLEDVAMQLGLPVDGQPVSGEIPVGHVRTTKFNIKLKWLRTRLQQMPLDLEDNGLMQYARCYILYLLGGVLLPDKANNTVHVRYLPLLADYDAICTYSWGSAVLCWLYRAMCLAIDYSVEGMAGCHTLLMSWIYYRLPFLAPNMAGKKGQNDYAEQRLLRHRLRLNNLHVDEFVWKPYMDPQILSSVPAEFLGHPHGDFYTAVVPLIFFRWIEILNVDRVLRQFGGKQGPPNPPLNIDTFHRQSASNNDGWWPVRLSEWFEEVVPAGTPEEYGRGPVVNLPPVPRDHRRRRPRRGRVEEHADPGEDRPDLPEEDRPGFEPDMGYHAPSQPLPVPGDYYYPQPFVQAEPTQPSSIQHFMPYRRPSSRCYSHLGGSNPLIQPIICGDATGSSLLINSR